jgi:hypothetical protein
VFFECPSEEFHSKFSVTNQRDEGICEDPWVRGAFYLVAKRPGLEADRSPPSSAEIKNT